MNFQMYIISLNGEYKMLFKTVLQFVYSNKDKLANKTKKTVAKIH